MVDDWGVDTFEEEVWYYDGDTKKKAAIRDGRVYYIVVEKGYARIPWAEAPIIATLFPSDFSVEDFRERIQEIQKMYEKLNDKDDDIDEYDVREEVEALVDEVAGDSWDEETIIEQLGFDDIDYISYPDLGTDGFIIVRGTKEGKSVYAAIARIEDGSVYNNAGGYTTTYYHPDEIEIEEEDDC